MLLHVVVAIIYYVYITYIHAGLGLFNLGTLMISDAMPSNTGIPKGSDNCDRTNCIGRVWIFFSDARLSTWGTISEIGIHNFDRHIICNQLGYNRSDIDHPQLQKGLSAVNNSIPVWLYNITCSSSLQKHPSNILQCNPKICEPGICQHAHDLIISCGEWD